MIRSTRSIARAVLAMACAMVLAAGAALPAAAQSNQEETFSRTLDVQAGSTLRLRTFSGRVTIRGTSGNQVIINAIRRAPADRLRDIQIAVTQNGSTVDINANHRAVERDRDNVVQTDFDIQVPARMQLGIRSFSAPILVENVQGSHHLKTFSGDVELLASEWDASAGLDIETFSGSARLRLPDTARGSLSFDSFSGRFDSDLPVTLQSSSRRTFRGELNGGGNATFRVKTFSGDARIRR